MCGYPPFSFLDSNHPCKDLLFPHSHNLWKNKSVLGGTILKGQSHRLLIYPFNANNKPILQYCTAMGHGFQNNPIVQACLPFAIGYVAYTPAMVFHQLFFFFLLTVGCVNFY